MAIINQQLNVIMEKCMNHIRISLRREILLNFNYFLDFYRFRKINTSRQNTKLKSVLYYHYIILLLFIIRSMIFNESVKRNLQMEEKKNVPSVEIMSCNFSSYSCKYSRIVEKFQTSVNI